MTTKVRWLAIGALLSSIACSGGLNCSGCLGGTLDPIPGGFDADALIERVAQVRLTRSGMEFFEDNFSDLLSAYAGQSCGQPGDLNCPMRYGAVCDQTSQRCVDQITGDGVPVLGFPIERSEQSGATVCRDNPMDPNARACSAFLNLERLALVTRGPNIVEATVTAKLFTTELPIRYDPLGMDCVVTMDSEASGSPLQDFVLTVELTEWNPASGNGGRQLDIQVTGLTAMIADDDISITRDPIHGTIGDVLICGLSNLGAIKQILVDRMIEPLRGILEDQIRVLLGRPCGSFGDPACPMGSACNTDGFCQEAGTSKIVPQEIGLEGRLDLNGLVAGLGGATDVRFLVGGPTSADAGGATIGVLGGMEAVPPRASCAMDLPSPRLRAGYMPPQPFPVDGTADLDWDGTKETAFMLGAGLSQASLDQAIWSVYSTGLFCGFVSSYDTELINTGSLSVLMPSLRQLTHQDRFAWATAPARLQIRPGTEPRLVIGSGKLGGTAADPTLEEPLLSLVMDDLELYFAAVVEERWVHLMKVSADVEVPLGIYVTPAGTFEILIGDVESAITNVSVSDHKILAETAMELEDAVPTLVGLVLPQITQFLSVPFGIPTPQELGGFEVDVLGIRGVEDGTGTGFDHVGLYVDLGFDPSLAPNLSFAVDTDATVQSLRLSDSDALAVTHVGGPVRPEIELALAAKAPAGTVVEYQYKLDDSLWSPFFQAESKVIRRAELLVQGEHVVQVRARVVGDYRTLDPTPSELRVVIDTEPPTMQARLSARKIGIEVHAYDVVSRDRVFISVAVDGQWRDVAPSTAGFVEVSEIADPDAEIRVAATDEVGRRTEVVLRRGFERAGSTPVIDAVTDAGGPTMCACASADRSNRAWMWLPLVGLALLLRRRR